MSMSVDVNPRSCIALMSMPHAALPTGTVFTSGDAFDYCLQGLEAHANNNLQVQVWMGVYSNDGSTLRATLRSKILEGLELATSLTSRYFSGTLSGSYTTVAGDRLVVEVSVSGTPTSGGGVQGHNASLRFGNDGAGGDLAENDTQTGTTLNPWIEFAAITLSQQYTITLDESVGAADAEPRGASKPLQEVVALADTLAKLTGKPLAEATAIADALLRSTVKVLAEGLPVADAVTRAVGRMLGDTATVADTLTVSRLFLKELIDAVSLADTLVRNPGKLALESVAIVEGRSMSLGRVLVDSLAVAEVLTRNTGRIVAQAVVIADAVTRAAGRTAVDPVEVLDVVRQSLARGLVDAFQLQDVVQLGRGKNLVEALAVVDVLLTELVPGLSSALVGIITAHVASLVPQRTAHLITSTEAVDLSGIYTAEAA